MNAPGQTICLNMIVKNEAEVIRRCLDSVRPIIDRWVIVDTGSTDGTQDIVREHMRDLPGELHERRWQDFAHNRSEALQLARGQCTYTLIIDADDELQIDRHNKLPALAADSYMFQINDASIVYQRLQLVRSALPWRYEGVLHEFLSCDEAASPGSLSEIAIRRNHDGARRKEPMTYKRDAAVLEAALLTEANPFLVARYEFYLAQSYRDCNEPGQSLKHYLARAELGYWQEEVFYSLYSAAQLMEQLGYPEQEILDAYMRAADASPTRAEALCNASRFCRERERYEEGYRIARRGLPIPLPPDALFVEPRVYDVGLLDEFSLNAYWSGHNWDCLDASLRMLAAGKLGTDEAQRIVTNAQFAMEGLQREPDLGSAGTESFVAQHRLGAPRPLRSRLVEPQRVLVAILASRMKECLSLYLECIEALDYPKSAIFLYIRTGGGAGEAEDLLRQWVDRTGHLYAGVEFEALGAELGFDHFDASLALEQGINTGFSRAKAHECDFYFVADLEDFVVPCTLRELVALNLPIVAPFLRSLASAEAPYSNFHAEVDERGYFKDCAQYSWVVNRHIRGVLEMPVVKCTYLIRTDVLDDLAYVNQDGRHDYVVFSEKARDVGIPQYLDNRQVYGYLLAGDQNEIDIMNDIELARSLLVAA